MFYTRPDSEDIVVTWIVTYRSFVNGFDFTVFIEGTEYEMHDYVESELGHVGRYTAANEKELQAISTLRLQTYLAPRSY